MHESAKLIRGLGCTRNGTIRYVLELAAPYVAADQLLGSYSHTILITSCNDVKINKTKNE